MDIGDCLSKLGDRRLGGWPIGRTLGQYLQVFSKDQCKGMDIGDILSKSGDTRLSWPIGRTLGQYLPPANLLREEKQEDLLTPPGPG